MNANEHVAALRALIRTDHEERVAEIQGWADAAAARGDAADVRWHLECLEQLEALPKPWIDPQTG